MQLRGMHRLFGHLRRGLVAEDRLDGDFLLVHGLDFVEVARKQGDLHAILDGRRRVERLLERIERGVAELGQPLVVRFAALLPQPDHLAGDAEQIGTHCAGAFQDFVLPLGRCPPGAVGGGHVVKHFDAFHAQLGIVLHGGAELALEVGLAGEQEVVLEPDEAAGGELVLAGQRDQRQLGGLQVGGALGAEGDQVGDAVGQAADHQRHLSVAVEGKLRHGGEARGRPGTAGGEYRVVVLDRFGVPLEVVGRFGGLAALVGAEEGEIQAVALERAAVGIAAEERDGPLGREYEAQVGVAFVLVEIVALAGVEADHGTDVARAFRAGFLQARDGGVALLERLRRGLLGGRGFHRRLGGFGGGFLDLAGDVFEFQQDGGLQAGAAKFFLPRGRVETVPQVVVTGGAELGDAIGDHVVVGEDQPASGDERSRSAAQPHGGELYVREERIGDVEAVRPGETG